MSDDNMRIWNAVCVTDPANTKPVMFGRKFTAIDAHSQIRAATAQFGPAGEGWGWISKFEIVTNEDGVALVVCTLSLWHGDRANFFTCVGANKLTAISKDGKRTADHDAHKKAETDALTKGLSRLGFNADVFLGLFDDNKYVEGLKADKEPEAEPTEPASKHPAPSSGRAEVYRKINAAIKKHGKPEFESWRLDHGHKTSRDEMHVEALVEMVNNFNLDMTQDLMKGG